jgi:hypothetical protein
MRGPFAVGENVIATTQDEPAASVPGAIGQVSSVGAKSLLFVPEMLTEEIVSGAFPEFVSVTVAALLVVPIGWLPKSMLIVEVTAAGAVPVPLSGTICGLPTALLETVMDAVSLAAAVGLNVTTMLHGGAPAARLLGQLLVCEKSVLPVMPMPLICSTALPVFESATVPGTPAMPSGTLPKFRNGGLKFAAGAAPASESFARNASGSGVVPLQLLHAPW